mgnify:CR=1 FL=1
MTVISTNVSALRAQNSSRVASMMQGQAMDRLSSGKRINSAKDDAAGLAISESEYSHQALSDILPFREGFPRNNPKIGIVPSVCGL